MKAALLVFGFALVAGQQFQEKYKTTSTSVVLATPGYFQRHALDFQRNQFSNDFQEGFQTKISDTPQNLQPYNYRGDISQQNSFASNLIRSSDADGYQSFDNQFRSGGFHQRESRPLTSQYGRYHGDQRRRFRQNEHDNVFQQSNQGLFQQRHQDNQLQRSSQQNLLSQNSRGNRFDQDNQENRFQQNRQRNFFHLNNQGGIFQQHNQENRFDNDNQSDQFQLNTNDALFRHGDESSFFERHDQIRADQFQLNTNDALFRHGDESSFFERHDQITRPSSAFVGENRPLRVIVSEDSNQRNSFDQQGQQFREGHFDQINTQFLESDFDFKSLPAGARFHLESVDTSFQCAHRPYGFYADQSSGCRVFHVCNPDIFVEGRPQNFQSSFMCGEGFIFDQRERTCVQEHLALPCHEASNYYFTYDK